MNNKSSGKFTKEKFNLKQRNIPFLVRLKNNIKRIKKHNAHKSLGFIFSCIAYGLICAKIMQFYFFAREFLIAIPRDEYLRNYLLVDKQMNRDGDLKALNNYLDQLVDLKVQREKKRMESKGNSQINSLN
jgi:hypothetical protein